MTQATFTPKFLNPPKGNARSATIKDTDGGFWGCHPGDLSKFQVNVPVTVDYVTRTGNDGRTYYNITSIIGQQAPGNPQAGQAQRPAQFRGPAQQSRPNGQFKPRDPQESENIFICGVVNQAIAHQSYPLDSASLAALVANARAAWRGEVVQDGQGDDPPFPGSPDDYGDVDPRG